MASAQLQLITTDPVWKLDERTVETGKAGIARARAALAAATALKEEFATELTSEHPTGRTTEHTTQHTTGRTTELATEGTLFEHATTGHQAAA